MTTSRQKAAVQFIEEMLGKKYKGDLNNFKKVSQFLHNYLDIAKYKYEIEKEMAYEALGSIGDTYFG